MIERNALKDFATTAGDKETKKQCKKKGKEIKKALIEEKKYYQKDVGGNMDLSSAWGTARVILGENNNLAPTAIKNLSENVETEIVKNPKRLANLFNNFFRTKI